MKFLVTGAVADSKNWIDFLEGEGHEWTFVQDERVELDIDLSRYEGVIGNGLFLTNDIDKFKSLKFIQLTSAGYDRVPMEKVLSRGIKIYNAGATYSVPMAEFALLGALNLYKNYNFFLENKKKKQWIKNRGVKEISGSTVCIVGCGNVGKQCAVRFSAFGATVIGVDIVEVNHSAFNECFSLDKIGDALSKSDIVVLTLPLTDLTQGLFGANVLGGMKTGAILINISRGKVVRETDLITALKSGKIAGAALDVFESEPLLPDSPLWDFENVIITPHNSFVGDGNNKRLLQTFKANLANFLQK